MDSAFCRRLATRIRQLADDTEAEVAAIPPQLALGKNPLPWNGRTPEEKAQVEKVRSVEGAMATTGRWIVEAIEAGQFVDLNAAAAISEADAQRTEVDASSDRVARPRFYVAFWYLLREWLPTRDADFDLAGDGNVGRGNQFFCRAMLRNIRRFAAAIETGNDGAPELLARDYSILEELANQRAELTLTQLAAALDCDEKTVRPHVKGLSARGLVAHPVGRRTRWLITTEGKRELDSRKVPG